jgi:hypothetical protein
MGRLPESLRKCVVLSHLPSNVPDLWYRQSVDAVPRPYSVPVHALDCAATWVDAKLFHHFGVIHVAVFLRGLNNFD